MACPYQFGSLARRDRCRLGTQAGAERRLAKYLGRANSLLAQFANSRRALPLAQLRSLCIADQGVVVEDRLLDRAEHPGQSQLAAGRLQQVFPSNDKIHSVAQVIDRD